MVYDPEELSFLTFKTSKKVTIRDWRIGLAHKSICLAIAVYYLVYRVAYLGDHLREDDVLSYASVKAAGKMTDSQWNFEPTPPCSDDPSHLKRMHPQDTIYEVVPGYDMLVPQEQQGQYFVPTKIWPTIIVDKMNRTFSEGYSAVVCKAICEKTNLTSSSQCEDVQTESDCSSSFMSFYDDKGLKVKECIWEPSSGTCSPALYFARCSPPCSSFGCDPCTKFCKLTFVRECAQQLNASSCLESYTWLRIVDSDSHAIQCEWEEGKCGTDIRNRMACPSFVDGQRGICEKPPSAAPESDCHIYESPIEITQPIQIEQQGGRVVASIDRLMIQYDHILTVGDKIIKAKDVEGFVVPQNAARKRGQFLPDQWEAITVTACDGQYGWYVKDWVRDGNILRCHSPERLPRFIDFIPLPALVRCAGKTLNCDASRGERASALEGFTLIVHIEYSNKRPWHIWGNAKWWSAMYVEHDTWTGSMTNLPLHNTTSPFVGRENFARGIRILFRPHGRVYRFSAKKILALIPEYLAFLAVVDTLFVMMFVSHNVLTRRYRCGRRWNRLASDWYCKFIFERTPNIVKVMHLVKRLLRQHATVTLTSKDETGFAGIECDHAGYITSVDEKGLICKMLQNWNDEHPILAVGSGDKILSVNGKTSPDDFNAEFAIRQAFQVDIEPCIPYPYVISLEAMKRLSVGANQSAFETTVPNILLPYEIKKQLKQFIQLALQDVQSDSRLKRGFSLHSNFSQLRLRSHSQPDRGKPQSPGSSASLESCDAESPRLPSGSSELSASAGEKIKGMERTQQKLVEQMADLVAWKALISNHFQTISPLWKSPAIQPTWANESCDGQAGGILHHSNGVERPQAIDPNIENRLLRLEADVTALRSACLGIHGSNTTSSTLGRLSKGPSIETQADTWADVRQVVIDNLHEQNQAAMYDELHKIRLQMHRHVEVISALIGQCRSKSCDVSSCSRQEWQELHKMSYNYSSGSMAAQALDEPSRIGGNPNHSIAPLDSKEPSVACAINEEDDLSKPGAIPVDVHNQSFADSSDMDVGIQTGMDKVFERYLQQEKNLEMRIASLEQICHMAASDR